MAIRIGNGSRVASNKGRVTGICGYRLPRSSRSLQPVKLLRRLGAKLAKALSLMSMRKQRSSCKVSSATLARSRSYAADSIDSHRAEAIEDCIEFLNTSSSSLHRSNSVSSCT
ncbi:hypothetical protein Nepgr_031891 [Nepenthes gracilis]|uniref:Josephin-like protein n=1 Tax=Nepenthes gracilis TaxID=150966 RepID=A0AAD3THK7_NEPGR|nr:hypothetical protein Nepgr_031891 [Nepenthes gracilis]